MPKQASRACWDRADFILFICVEKHLWKKGPDSRAICLRFWEMHFCPSGCQRVDAGAARHHVTICECPFLRWGQMIMHKKHKQKQFSTWRFCDLEKKKSMCFLNFLAYLSFKVANRIEWSSCICASSQCSRLRSSEVYLQHKHREVIFVQSDEWGELQFKMEMGEKRGRGRK